MKERGFDNLSKGEKNLYRKLRHQQKSEQGKHKKKTKRQFDTKTYSIYPNFTSFLKANWWFLLLALSKAFGNAEGGEMTGSVSGDVLALMGVILIVMWIYWAVRYYRD